MNRRMDEDEIGMRVRRTYHATQIPPLSHPEPRGMATAPARPRWLLPALAAAGVVVLLSGVALFLQQPSRAPEVVSVAGPPSGEASVDPSPSDSGLSPSERVLQNRMADAIHKIDDFTQARDQVYDTAVFDVRKRVLTIYRADNVPERQAALYQPLVPGGITVRYAKALLSVKQRNELASVVQNRQEDMQKRGIHLTAWGAEETPGGRFQIGYDPSFAKPQSSDLTPFERFGAGTVVFVPEKPIAGWGPLRVDR